MFCEPLPLQLLSKNQFFSFLEMGLTSTQAWAWVTCSKCSGMISLLPITSAEMTKYFREWQLFREQIIWPRNNTSAPSTQSWTLSIVPVSSLTLWKALLAPRPPPPPLWKAPLASCPRPYHLTSPRRKSTFFCSDSFELIQLTLFQTKPSYSCSNFH